MFNRKKDPPKQEEKKGPVRWAFYGTSLEKAIKLCQEGWEPYAVSGDHWLRRPMKEGESMCEDCGWPSWTSDQLTVTRASGYSFKACENCIKIWQR